ncbi:hypothetical protein A8C56_06755 [Niabella ginsenosidivorans]|uniref:Uncharacterized protein n=1 Tax=Niabella ginsenosidivorans TaxID=1176587 RepID=A0A1A9I052_9BACT|nr:hypothetical protein A8C56_06755 [Niabella ginsenosidivorans]
MALPCFHSHERIQKLPALCRKLLTCLFVLCCYGADQELKNPDDLLQTEYAFANMAKERSIKQGLEAEHHQEPVIISASGKRRQADTLH